MEQLLSAATCPRKAVQRGSNVSGLGVQLVSDSLCEATVTKAYWVVSTIEVHCFAILEFWVRNQSINRTGSSERSEESCSQLPGFYGRLEICDAFKEASLQVLPSSLHRLMPVWIPGPCQFHRVHARVDDSPPTLLWSSQPVRDVNSFASNMPVHQGSGNWDFSMWVLGSHNSAHQRKLVKQGRIKSF